VQFTPDVPFLTPLSSPKSLECSATGSPRDLRSPRTTDAARNACILLDVTGRKMVVDKPEQQ